MPAGVWPEVARQLVAYMATTNGIATELDIAIERLTLGEGLGGGEDTEIFDPISLLGHAMLGSGPSNSQSHPSPASEWSLCGDISTLSTGSSWVTTPGSTLTFTSTPSTQSPTTASVEVGPTGLSWITVGPSLDLGATPGVDSRLSIEISTEHTANMFAHGGNELHPAFGNGMLSTSKERSRPRYAPKLQPAEDVFLTKDAARARRLRQNYILGAPRLRGYRGCTAPCCSCKLRIEDFEQSPIAKRFRFTHMSEARAGCSWRHDFSRR